MKTEKIPDTRIVAYRIGGVIHCIECATTWAIDQSIKRGGYGRVRVGEHNVIEYLVAYSNGTWDRDIVPHPIPKFLVRSLNATYENIPFAARCCRWFGILVARCTQ